MHRDTHRVLRAHPLTSGACNDGLSTSSPGFIRTTDLTDMQWIPNLDGQALMLDYKHRARKAAFREAPVQLCPKSHLQSPASAGIQSAAALLLSCAPCPTKPLLRGTSTATVPTYSTKAQPGPSVPQNHGMVVLEGSLKITEPWDHSMAGLVGTPQPHPMGSGCSGPGRGLRHLQGTHSSNGAEK